MRACSQCHESKAATEFRGNRSRCNPCERALDRKRYDENREAQKARKLAAYHAMTPEARARHQELRKQYFLANPDRRASSEYFKAYYQSLSDEQKRQKVAKLNDWSKARPHLHAARQKHREARKIQAMPPWANESAIEEIYKQARERTDSTGVEHHVDHIVPLNNSRVCGLHCEANLRVITATENCQKSNRYWPGM